MYWDVIEAKISGPLEFDVLFSDGLTGKVIMKDSHLTGVFQALTDPEIFQQLQVTDGFVTWPGDIDLAPDAMHDSILEQGYWILDIGLKNCKHFLNTNIV